MPKVLSDLRVSLEVSLYKSVEVHISVNAFSGMSFRIIKRKSKVHRKDISRELI